MKPLLQLNLTQKFTLTPQLQQAIRLLQLSTLDLQHEIQQQVESNPLLEAEQTQEKDKSIIEQTTQTEDEFADFQWSNLYTTQSHNNSFNESDYVFETVHCTTTSLQDHLRWQLDLTPMTDVDRVIATAIIDAIDNDGILTLSLEDLHASLNSESHPLDLDEIVAVKHRIQHFDPVGCGANNLVEALLIQLGQLPETTPYLLLTLQIINEDIELLGQHNYPELKKKYQISEIELDKILLIIQNLNPKPGNIISAGKTEYTTPDLTVKKIDGRWQVMLNQSALPRLSINSYYASLIKRTDKSADNQFLKNNLQEARWFLKSIQSRQETLLKVASYIVNYQHDFFELGVEAMRPLILREVAIALDMHESTISRVTTQKYIYTPRGLLELKYFFSNHIAMAQGGACSATAIRAMLKKLITGENLKKPFSDNKLAALINEQGIHIARRTVAKYREAMGIASSNERKIIRN